MKELKARARLLDLLDGHPLRLKLAAKYMSVKDVVASKYIELIEESSELKT